MLLTALKPQGYAGRQILIGQTFDASTAHAIALVGARAAQYARYQKPISAFQRTVESPGIDAEPETIAVPAKPRRRKESSDGSSPKPKRKYIRRDMVPQD